MENKTQYISITEMARLRGITTETLRHYDRIGLLKPDYVDENKTRYYSVLQYEKLGTIKELRQLGMRLQEIKEYIGSRTLQSSLKLLEQQKEMVEARLTELDAIREKTAEKLAYLSSISENSYDDAVVIKEFSQRRYITFDEPVHNEIELAYAVMRLEKIIYKEEKYFPIYATDRYGALIGLNQAKDPIKSSRLICFISEDNYSGSDIKTLPAGKYCCIRNKGDFWEREKPIARLQQFLHANNLSPCFDRIVENVIVDYTISDNISERLFEFQLLCGEIGRSS